MAEYTYEESVNWIRSQPELAETVKQCYLDEDNLVAAKRFAASEEFADVKNLLQLDRANGKLKVLDLGCGNGIVSYAFAGLGHDVWAVDPDESADVGLEAAKRLAPLLEKGSITTIKAFAEELPFEDEFFDIIYTRQAVHHFGDLNKGFQECSRVLSRSGKLFATREHVVSDEKQHQLFLDRHLLHRLHGGENAYPLPVYEAALQQAGLKIVNTLGYYDSVINYFPANTTKIKDQLSYQVSQKIGRVGARICMSIPALERYYRRRCSETYDEPGRFYSFLCYKSV